MKKKCWVQHILWSSKILFCLWIDAYIFFSSGHIRNVVSTLPNVVQFNVEKHNVVSTLFYVVNFNVHIHADLTLCDKNNVELTLKCLLGSFIQSPLKTVKNAFYFVLEVLFVLKIFKFFPWLFGHVGKTALLER